MGASDFTIFAAFAVILAVLLIGGTLVAGPIRRKMVVLANELYDAPGSTERSRRRLDFLLDSATSPLIAVLMVVAAAVTLVDALFFGSEPPPQEPSLDDPRYDRLLGLYLASIGLANPLVTILFLPFVGICAIIIGCVEAIKGTQVADQQIERVAHSRLART
jgi:hypothetical protein